MRRLKTLYANLLLRLAIKLELLGERLSVYAIDKHRQFETDLGLQVTSLIKKTEEAAKLQVNVRTKELQQKKQQDLARQYDKEERTKIFNMITGRNQKQ